MNYALKNTLTNDIRKIYCFTYNLIKMTYKKCFLWIIKKIYNIALTKMIKIMAKTGNILKTYFNNLNWRIKILVQYVYIHLLYKILNYESLASHKNMATNCKITVLNNIIIQINIPYSLRDACESYFHHNLCSNKNIECRFL